MPFDNTLNADGALIIGAGLAGLFCALKLAPRPVTVLSPKPLGFGASSAWAQGGVAAAVGGGDTPHAHALDTEKAGAGIVDVLTAESVAAFIQAVLQGSFIFAKARQDAAVVRANLAHLRRYLESLLGAPKSRRS